MDYCFISFFFAYDHHCFQYSPRKRKDNHAYAMVIMRMQEVCLVFCAPQTLYHSQLFEMLLSTFLRWRISLNKLQILFNIFDARNQSA
jgi:hypothetical protein